MISSDFRAEARRKLAGKWGKTALITLAYFAIFFVMLIFLLRYFLELHLYHSKNLFLYLNNNTSNIIRLLVIALFSYILLYDIIRFLYKKVIKFRKYQAKTQITSIIFTILICAYFYVYSQEDLNLGCFYLIVGLFIGMMSHIFLDFFNPTGIPLFLPISNKKFHILGISEKYGIVFSIIFSILVLLSTFKMFGVIL